MNGRGPGRAGYWIGALAIVLGIVLASVLVVTAAVGFGDRIDDFERVSVPGERDVALDEGGYTLYYEVVGLADEASVVAAPLDIRLTGAGGDLPVAPYTGDFTYDIGSRSGVAISTVDVPAAGTYRLAVQAAGEPSSLGPSARVAIGRGVTRGLVGGVVGGLAAFFGGLLGGAVLIAVTAVRRRRARRPPVPPGAGWPGWPGWPPPRPGWDQPPVAPPGWGQPTPPGWGEPPPPPGWPPSGPGWAPPPAAPPPPGPPGWGPARPGGSGPDR